MNFAASSASGSSTKRPRSLSPNSDDVRPDCQYGQNCYRRNPTHFREFKHSVLENLYKTLTRSNQNLEQIPTNLKAGFDDISVVVQQLKMLRNGNYDFLKCDNNSKNNQKVTAKNDSKKIRQEAPDLAPENQPNSESGESEVPGAAASASVAAASSSKMQIKWNASCPYNFFLTKIPGESDDVPYSVSFLDIFDKSFGSIKAICHFNFMVDAEWFIDQSMLAGLENIPTTIIYGIETQELSSASKVFPWLKIHLAKSPFPFGHHHTKMTLIQYTDDSLRFVIMTANLIESDWENRTQGVWVSPRCPKFTQSPATSTSDSPTKFKADLLQYLSTYPSAFLSNWISLIKCVDCSKIKAVLIASAPTTAQSATNGFQWGLMKMESMIKRIPQPDEIDPTWPLIMQCSSIATLGGSDDWLRGELGSSMLGNTWAQQVPIRVIYPSDSNVRQSVDGIHGGGCLPYNKSTHAKQIWLLRNLYQWKASSTGRSRIMPHIKTYCRVSSDFNKLGWFLLTSSNLSKAAWGKLTKNHDRLSVMSWEAGVLFLPHFFGSDEPFTIAPNPNKPSPGEFMVPYDLPLQKYNTNDQPWFIDTLMELRP